MSDAPLHHRLSVCKRLGPLPLQIQLGLHADWTLLFGPSGSGKSTLLRAACGLLTQGGICFERRQPNGNWLPLQTDRVNLPPSQRGIRWAPQRASLFPHLNVQDNIAFGTRVNQARSASEQNLSDQAIELFRLAPLASRLPRDLSGGERQRVNLARAFAAPGCRLLLLDEPFAGIDRALRDELLPQMRSWLEQRGIPVLSVSHDVEETLQLRAHVVVLCGGQLQAEGPAATVLAPEIARSLRSLSRDA